MLRSLALVLSASAFDGVVAPAPKDAKGPVVGMVYVHGAKCEPKAYLTAIQWLQEEVKDSMQLNVALPLFSTFVYPDAPLPFLIDAGVDEGFAELEKLTVDVMKSKFLAGHSMGGALAPGYKKADTLQGMISLGAYLTRSYRQKGYPIPALMVGAELDGGAGRVMRMAEEFNAYYPSGFDEAQAQKNPIVIVEGMSHAQFLSGPAPAKVVDSDIIPEIKTVDAHKKLAEIIGAFLKVNVLKENSDVLESEVKRTADLVAPYVETLRLEGFPYLTKVGEVVPRAVDGTQVSPWTLEVLNNYVAPFTNAGGKVNITSGIFGLNFEHQHPTPEMQADGMVHVASATNNAYNLVIEKVDVQYGPLATYSLGWKFVELEKLFETAKIAKPTDFRQPTCRDINQMALDYALAHLPASQKARHTQYGDDVELLDDTTVLGNIGPLWVATNLKQSTDAKSNAITIQGVVEDSPTGGKYPYPGSFYCKSLSPGYALDLLSTESLRRQRGLKTDPTFDNSDAGPYAQKAILV